MKSEKVKSILIIAFLGIIGFAVQKLLFYFWVPATFEAEFVYAVPLVYLFFFCFSALLILILYKVKQNQINSVGYVFLLLTTLKMVMAYMMVKPILAETLPKTTTEKMSFFIVFIYFLAIETYVTIRILNNKQ
ncbi:hypothetical protein [Flavobacterium sp.]|uniref:hypothetical protein n=1 Tax=Flavobacterium sp. TaxID=239 RepID=UPI002FDCA198